MSINPSMLTLLMHFYVHINISMAHLREKNPKTVRTFLEPVTFNHRRELLRISTTLIPCSMLATTHLLGPGYVKGHFPLKRLLARFS